MFYFHWLRVDGGRQLRSLRLHHVWRQLGVSGKLLWDKTVSSSLPAATAAITDDSSLQWYGSMTGDDGADERLWIHCRVNQSMGRNARVVMSSGDIYHLRFWKSAQKMPSILKLFFVQRYYHIIRVTNCKFNWLFNWKIIELEKLTVGFTADVSKKLNWDTNQHWTICQLDRNVIMGTISPPRISTFSEVGPLLSQISCPHFLSNIPV